MKYGLEMFTWAFHPLEPASQGPADGHSSLTYASRFPLCVFQYMQKCDPTPILSYINIMVS